MAALAPLDLAALPVSGWGRRVKLGHLDAGRAAETLRLLEPRVAVPIHWGTYVAPLGAARPSGPPSARGCLCRARSGAAPAVEVRIVDPGESTNV
jgi:L-ascorbate metabolism protein UlaG (beta-lactamase superfamily)